MTRISTILTRILPWVLIAVLLFNLTQRRHMDVGVRKRFATLWIGGLVAGLWGAAIVFQQFAVPDVYLTAAAAALVLVAYLRRDSIFLFRLRCARCGARLAVDRILYHDEALCSGCGARAPEVE